MYNLIVQNILAVVIFSIVMITMRNSDNFYYILVTFLVIYTIYTAISYYEYMFVKYIRENHLRFYLKHESRIGVKGWLKELKKELDDLNDEYINSKTKNL
jgi:Kef-type K+ transport system membrane component KefB